MMAEIFFHRREQNGIKRDARQAKNKLAENFGRERSD